MKRGSMYWLILLVVSQTDLRAQSPMIQQIIDSVSVDSLIFFVKELSGEVPTMINGTPQTILSRHSDQPGNALAETYIKQKLESYGLPVTIQKYSAAGTNVLATQVGTVFPHRKFVISAHYDDMPEGPIAPGADDNGSGVAAVLEAARVLRQHSFPLTIVYALWDEEEIVIYPAGSTYYAGRAADVGDSILGVINLDNIAYDGNNDGKCGLQERPTVRSVQIRDNMVDLNSQYGLGLNVIAESPLGSSDHAPFWYHGFDAILLWNYPFDGDATPFYHTVKDRVGAFNNQHYLARVKLALASLAFCASYLNFDVTHTPIATVVPTQATHTDMFIYTALRIGTGSLAPRMCYRTKESGGNYGTFREIIGTATGSGDYTFTIPALPNGTFVQYYLAAQDENSTTVRTSPVGGGGFNPPGSIPPGTFHEFLVADLLVIWSDSANSLTNWTATGGWNITTEQSVSPPTAFTDSPGGNYPPNSYAVLTCNDQIPAQSTLKTFLEFDTRWAMEYGFHYGKVQITTNGGRDWYSLGGQYTYWGRTSPSFSYSSIYSGVQSTWVHEICDISNYASYPFKVRYVFVSDQWTYFVPMDGWYIDNVKVSVLRSTDAIESVDHLPATFTLAQNFPNPFNPSTTIKYELPKSSDVRLTVFDMLGREVSVLVNERRDAGVHEVKFDGSNIASGVYFYRLQAGDFTQAKRLVVIK